MTRYSTNLKHGLEHENRSYQALSSQIARQGVTILHLPSNSPYPDIIVIFRFHGITRIIGIECKNWAEYTRTSGHVWNLMVPKFEVGDIRYDQRIVLMSTPAPLTENARQALDRNHLEIMTLPQLIKHLKSLIERWSFYVMPSNNTTQVIGVQAESSTQSDPKPKVPMEHSGPREHLVAPTLVCVNAVPSTYMRDGLMTRNQSGQPTTSDHIQRF
jgi:hypothetical protein